MFIFVTEFVEKTFFLIEMLPILDNPKVVEKPQFKWPQVGATTQWLDDLKNLPNAAPKNNDNS